MTRRSVPTAAPEGGWGWVVVIASCWANGVICGIINSFGVLYIAMLNLEGADAFKTSWVGSVCAGMTFFMSPFASIITDRLGCRLAAVIGGTLALAGVLTSSFATRIEHLYITYGLAMGLGFSIAFQPSLYILGIYFQKRLGIANGLVSTGSSIFTVALPLCMREILYFYGLGPCLWLLSSVIFVMILGALTFRPRPEVVEILDLKEDYVAVQRNDDVDDDDDSDGIQVGRGCCSGGFRRRWATICSNCSCSSIIDVSIWKDRNYRIWAISMPLGLFGYFVPFFHLVKHVDETLPEARAEVLIMCIGATSGIGRIAAGFLSDHPKINPVHIQQVAFLVIGVSTAVLPLMTNFIALCATLLVMGIFDGAFFSTIGTIAFSLVGPQRASQAIGMVLGIMSIPMMVGPPVAGFLYDMTGNYTVAFALAGIPPMITVCALFYIRPANPDIEPDDHIKKPYDTEEKEQALMIPRKRTASMIAKEMETGSRLANHADVVRDGDGEDWRTAFIARGSLEDDHGRRRSYRRDVTSPSDTRIIMENHVPHSNGTHHPNGVHSNGRLHRSTAFRDGLCGKGVLASAYGLEDQDEGNRSPYAKRGCNHSNHYSQNGRVPRNRGASFEMNGIVHGMDSPQKNGITGTTIGILERETPV